MPESEPKPKLIELMASGAGQGWKAVLRNGKPAVVHEIPVPQAEVTAAVPRLQRLFEHRHPALSPVLAWGTDQNGIWVATEPNEGTPLSSILSRGPMTPPSAAALGAAVLSGVAALHETGIAMGGFGATAVRVTSNGEVRLAGHPAAAVRGAPSQSDLRADVRSCGMAVCAAFGVDPAGAPAPPNIPPGLVVTMRSMASGAMGPSADRAQGALREMAASLLAPDRQMAAQSELATRAGGREVPAITPFLPAGEAPPPRPQTFAPTPAAPAVPPAPSPFIAPPRRDEAAARGSVYEAPDRPLQTYPSMPAITFPPVPAPAPAASAAVETPPSAPAVPTWAEAPAPAAAEAVTAPPPTNPPAPAPMPWDAPAAEPEPPQPVPAFQSSPPVPAFATAPPAPASPAPAAPPPQPTWTPVEAPVWKPGEAVPSEPLGTGYAIEVPNLERSKTPTPAPPVRAPIPPPERRPPVPRPRMGGGGPSERPPWLVPGAAAVLVIILLGIFGVVVLGKLGGANNNVAVHQSPSTHATGSPKSSPSSSPSNKGPLTVPTYGPNAAAPITKVQFCSIAVPCAIAHGVADETATVCDLNAACSIEVAVYFSTGQKVPVKYDLKFFDRCSGQETDLPGPPDYTPPGYAVVIPRDRWTVNLPSGGKSGALVAVTSKPGVAASAPLMLGGDSC
ncbi:MAG: hypothetical protein E6I72_13810 [Chloroflexi bacterium]|nr:MAG: hypothetical protein E6I72_13810 [Chloroflexota bacterium]